MRLFIAILFNKEIRGALTDLQDDMKSTGVTGNYTKQENLHLTLAFIGDYNDPEEVLEAIKQSAVRPFSIKLDGVGSFGAHILDEIRKGKEWNDLYGDRECLKQIHVR